MANRLLHAPVPPLPRAILLGYDASMRVQRPHPPEPSTRVRASELAWDGAQGARASGPRVDAFD